MEAPRKEATAYCNTRLLGSSGTPKLNVTALIHFPKFQLCCGDYFKEAEFAHDIAERATAVIGWLNGHRKVRKIFDQAQAEISLDQTGKAIVLAYLVGNLTRGTTHCIAFMWLHRVQPALTSTADQKHGALIRAQVGAATGKEATHLHADAEHHIDIISDGEFWSGLSWVIQDLKPICLGTNIGQKDSTQANQVLLTLAGMYNHFSGHSDPQVAVGMTKCLECWWKGCDQPMFLLKLILNPWEGVAAFGLSSGMDQFKCAKLFHIVSEINQRSCIWQSWHNWTDVWTDNPWEPSMHSVMNSLFSIILLSFPFLFF